MCNVARYRSFTFIIVASSLFLVGFGQMLMGRLALNLALLECNRLIQGQTTSCSLEKSTWTQLALNVPLPDQRLIYHLGRDSLFADESGKAIRYLSEAADLDPNDVPAGLFLGLAYRQIGDEAAALEAWRQVGAGKYFLTRGRSRYSAGDVQTALALGETAPSTYYLLGDLLWQTGQREKAADTYKNVLSLKAGDSFDAWLARGRVRDFEQDWMGAINAYEQAIKVNPLAFQGYMRIGDIYRERLSDPTRALEWYKRAVRNSRSYMSAYISAGEMEMALGHYDNAFTWFDRARQRFPRDSFPYVYLGLLWSTRHNMEQARAAYAKAISVDPGNFWAHYYLGITAMESGDWEQAITYLRRATELNPDFVEIQLRLGEAYIKAGQTFEAIAVYSHVLELEPQNAQAKDALIRLGIMK